MGESSGSLVVLVAVGEGVGVDRSTISKRSGSCGTVNVSSSSSSSNGTASVVVGASFVVEGIDFNSR